MKIHLDFPNVRSFALDRVKNALLKHAPSNIEFVKDNFTADLVIFNVIGRQDRITRTISKVKEYAIIQYCLRSTLRPETKGWIPIWKGARLIWSYLDLKMLCQEDNNPADFNFYHAPLGVDFEIFKRYKNLRKRFIVCTSGKSALVESTKEAIIAGNKVGKKIFHLGKELSRPNTLCRRDLDDIELTRYYNQCYYVSGLRRTEGFELPAIEGFFCGVRPIFFDRPHYRKWFSDIGLFIPETTREEVTNNLTKIFSKPFNPVMDEEQYKTIFDWERIVSEFYVRIY